MKFTGNATKFCQSWSNVQKAQFHYFSQFGLFAQKDKFDKEITSLVESGKCKSGAILAYGSLNYFHTSELRKLAMAKRVSNADLFSTLKGIERDIESARKFIQEKK
jgi:hypothetical protein